MLLVFCDVSAYGVEMFFFIVPLLFLSLIWLTSFPTSAISTRQYIYAFPSTQLASITGELSGRKYLELWMLIVEVVLGRPRQLREYKTV